MSLVRESVFIYHLSISNYRSNFLFLFLCENGYLTRITTLVIAVIVIKIKQTINKIKTAIQAPKKMKRKKEKKEKKTQLTNDSAKKTKTP